MFSRLIVAVLLLASLLCVSHCATKTTAAQITTLLNAMTPSSTSPGCVNFSPYVSGYRSGQAMTNTMLAKLLTIIKSQTKYRCIMDFSVNSQTVALARSYGFKVLGIVWLTTSASDNARETQKAITAVKSYPGTVVGLSCGSEFAFRNGITSTTTNIIKKCLSTLRSAGITVPLGSNESLKTLNTGWTSVYNEVDFLGVNIYPWYDNAGGGCLRYTDAAAQTYKRYVNVKNRYPKKPIIVTETGWPGSGSSKTSKGCGIASDSNQKYVVKQLTALFKTNKAPLCMFSGFREPWKASASASSPGAYFGLCSAYAPYNCIGHPTSW